MNRTANPTRAQRIILGLAASSGGFAIAFPAARELGPIPVLMSLAAAGAIVGVVVLVRRAIKGGRASVGDRSAVAETLASL